MEYRTRENKLHDQHCLVVELSDKETYSDATDASMLKLAQRYNKNKPDSGRDSASDSDSDSDESE